MLQLPNYPPVHGIRVPADDMGRLVTDLFIRVGMAPEEAQLTASLLVECDLRCVFSHGTRHAPEYVRKIVERFDGQDRRPVVDQFATEGGEQPLLNEGT